MPTALQPLRWHAFHLPKKGNTEAEYEDAFAGSAERARFAVADGASESSFAGEWARLLVRGFLSARRPWEDTAWLGPLREQWAAEIGHRPLPWYAEMKREQGAYATFLGFALRRRDGDKAKQGHWWAIAVGDSCLIQVRDGSMVTSFPVCHSSDFGNQPQLIASRVSGSSARPSRLQRTKGRWQLGDHFLLMTDALAQWYLWQCEQKQRPWDRLQSLLVSSNPVSDFAILIADLRERRELRNDDVTLLMAELTPERPSEPV